MNEIMKKTYELIDVLDESELIHELEVYRDKVMNRKEICDLVCQGNGSDDSYLILDIKRRLYQDDDYKSYMERYNELWYLVMEINSRYQKLIGKGCCHR